MKGDVMDDNRLDEDEASASQLHYCLDLTSSPSLLKLYSTKQMSNVPARLILTGHV